MSIRMNETFGASSYDGLLNAGYPPADVFSISLRTGQGTLARGSVLALSDRDGAFVLLGTDPGEAVEAAAAEYALTSDTALTSGKTYYTRSGSAGSYVYTAVTSPLVANIATYYEMTQAAVTAQDAETLRANCVLADDTQTGEVTGSAVTAVAYRTGHFSRNKLGVADGYTLTAADEEALRGGGILLSDAFEM